MLSSSEGRPHALETRRDDDHESGVPDPLSANEKQFGSFRFAL